MTENWHGTAGGYNNHACRCDDCKAAKRVWADQNRAYLAAYYRGYRARNPERIAEIKRRYRQRKRDE